MNLLRPFSFELSKNNFRLSIIILLSFFVLSSCDKEYVSENGEHLIIATDFSSVVETTRDVDFLFVINDSPSMTEELILLRSQFSELMRVLKEISGGLPNVHIAVITGDLGTGANFISPGCDKNSGGRFEKGNCVNPVGQSFIVDIEPSGCDIIHNYDNDIMCDSNSCTQENCEQELFIDSNGSYKEPAGLTLQVDENGCPRCRNYQNESLNDVFSCITDVGSQGCQYSQLFEAMYQSLSKPNDTNEYFLRDDAYLSITFISDSDDCSVRSNSLFNPQNKDILSPLGPLTTFRCTEFGISCDEAWNRNVPKNYINCHSKGESSSAMLNPLSKYINYLYQLKDSMYVMVSAIAGPYENSLEVLINNGLPELKYICGGATSGVRLTEFVSEFNKDPIDMLWAYTSVCSNDYTPALIGVGNKIKSLEETSCNRLPLEGCPDPAAAMGEEPVTALPPEIATICSPNCVVKKISPNSDVVVIPVCPSDYKGGHPYKLDPFLPLDECYYISYNERCDVGSDHSPSRGAEFIISRRKPFKPGTSVNFKCQALPTRETNCFDGIDNDMDGFIDGEDEECKSNDK